MVNNTFDITTPPNTFIRDIPITDVDPITNMLMANIGVFDKIYHFWNSWSRADEDVIAEWLSLNCVSNFIFIKIRSSIIAGGKCNNAEFWIDENNAINNNIITNHVRNSGTQEYFVKLYFVDVTMFEMVWLTKFIGSV